MSKAIEAIIDTANKQVGRLAMRVEGDKWVAYYAMPNTMQHALWLGSVKLNLVAGNNERKEQFMHFMQDAVSDAMKEALGVTAVSWPDPPQPAPESERSGSA